ncbi:MAG: ribonuclease R [Chitinophagales bacterium]|nr:ribonuclease R [Chitinophagales bacterium]
MAEHHKNQNRQSRAEHALVNHFLQEQGRFVSFKQLKKKFSSRFHKDELYQAVQTLLASGFLQQHGSQFRHSLQPDSVAASAVSDSLVEGIIEVTAAGHGYVISSGNDQDIFINRDHRHTALNGDKVKVSLLKHNRRKPEGRVIEIMERARDTFTGIIEQIGGKLYLIPDEKSMDIDFIVPAGKSAGAKKGEKAVVKMISWEPGAESPVGEVIKVLGKAGENDTEMQSILIENGFRLEFDGEALKESESYPEEIEVVELQRRRDFRDVTTFTIDPEDAKDFDDAISFRVLDKDLYEVGVHIADVTHYIKPGSALDREALLRATSVYLVDRCVPMLPERLSNGICSLTPEKDKLCFSVVLEMDGNGTVKGEWFGKTVIHSKRRYAYEAAQEVLDGKADEFAIELMTLNAIAKQLRAKRFKNGAINFDTIEVKFRLDDAANPVDVFVKERKDAHLLIEDFMLLANRKVAEFVGSRKGKTVPFVYRVHDLPDDEKLSNFAEFAQLFGYKLNFSTPKHTAHSFNRMMEKLKGKPEQYMLETLAIRTMAKAVYTTKNIGHYGLSFEYYTHFTSPIRRYPDMMSHRILEQVLKAEKVIDNQLENRCNHCSEMERNAADAERTSVKLKQVEYMSARAGELFDGFISGVTEWGIFVMTEGSYCEGMVRLDALRTDFFVYDKKKHCVKGMRTGRKLQLGDKVKVKLLKTNVAKRTIDFVLIETQD